MNEDRYLEELEHEQDALHFNHLNHIEISPGLEICVSKSHYTLGVELLIDGAFKKQILAMRRIWLKAKERKIKKQLKINNRPDSP